MGEESSRRAEISDVRAYLARARAHSRQVGVQIEAFSARVAALKGLGGQTEALTSNIATVRPPPEPTPNVDWLRRHVERQDEELVLAREELRSQHEALLEAYLALEKQHERYQDLFENAPDAYLTTDARGVIREANRAAGALLGVPSEVLTGKLLIAFVARRDTSTFRERLNVLLTEGGVGTLTLKLRARGGLPFPAMLAARPVQSRRDGSIELRWTVRREQNEVSSAERDLLAAVASTLRASIDGGRREALALVEDIEQLARATHSEGRAAITPAALLSRAAERAAAHGSGATVAVGSVENGVHLQVDAERASWALARLLSLLGSTQVRGCQAPPVYVFELRAVGAGHLGGTAVARAAVHAALGAEGGGLCVSAPGDEGDEALVCEVTLPLIQRERGAATEPDGSR